ncbi:hypothetical protein [Parabacteroides sp. AF17-28]|uniref:hypothetical protein n=1 Tax=Parabacteroides sp. AF17-28 TaxID=2292241 RepID=UPI000F00CAA9|nr:hypothetical protein [Parabacteroides sp. AF17-28]RHR61676.1 hypothetical protein DWW90_02515 [Parabacteroides sp. AF17-28]
MVIYNKTGQIILDIPLDDNSYRYRAIRQGDKVYLYFSLTQHIEIPIYSYIDFQGQRYTLWKPENLTKHGERNLEYNVEFGGWWELLNRTKYKLLSAKPHKLKFPLTAKPRLFMQLLVDNLNLHDSGWTLGTCMEASEKALAFNHETCMEVLNRMADEWNTEFEFVGKTVNFGKVERFRDDPLPLSYGKGNGFKTGVARQNQGEKVPVSILYVQGGDRNIDVSAYGSSTLLLPKGQEIEYEGRRYKTDADGMFITRADRELTTYNEDGYDAANIYPSRVGTISEVIAVDATKNFYDFKDNTIPDALDYSQCRIAGEKATIIFQSGIMTGKEFDLEQTDDALTGYIHAERRFKIRPQEIDGTIMPNDTFKPAVGDTYAIFHISLPSAYVCDNTTQTGASWDMFREAVKYLYEHEEECFTFTGELDGIWAKKKWLEIGGRLQPGSYILFSDTQFQPDGLPIRITGVKDYINNPHGPELELSNTPVAGFLSSDLGKLEGNEVKDEERHNEALSFTKRRWRDAVEALSMLEAAISGFSASINPITIQTMAMLVGDESLQFRFINSKTNPSEIIPDFKYNQQTKVFTIPTTILQHMTLGVDKLSSSHAASEYKYWNMSAYISPPLDEITAMYLYSKCSKSGTTGTFLLSKPPYKMDPGDGYYYFLTGALSSEYENERSFVTVYGFTEILPGRITVGMIVSPDGQTYFNVAQGEFGGKFVFKSASGYNNITDKPDLSIYGTKDLLNSIKDNLQNQIDGKIDTYYQSSNPWNSWPSGTEPEHVGDMWYNTSTGVLQTYIGPSSNIWREIVDPAAVEAAKAAATAADVKADSKRRVFTATPYPPYDVGDQWITYGTKNSSMFICKTSRSAGSSYNPSDWQKADIDGNTQVTIDRGIVTASGFLTFGSTAGMRADGTIRLWCGGTKDNPTFQVSNAGEVMAKTAIRLQNNMAGLTGVGTAATSVRFWAGSSTPESAPFRVTQNGMAYMSGGKIGRFSVEGIDSNSRGGRLIWNQADYFGGVSRSLKLGYSKDYEGVVDVYFNPATDGKFGVKAVGATLGSAAIYGSSKSSPAYPSSLDSWAGYFDGSAFASKIWSDQYVAKSAKGRMLSGLDGAIRFDNSDTWLVFAKGLCVGARKMREYDPNADT